jgi:hypothetical protein
MRIKQKDERSIRHLSTHEFNICCTRAVDSDPPTGRVDTGAVRGREREREVKENVLNGKDKRGKWLF